MDVVSQLFKYTQIFKNKEVAPDASQREAAQDSGIAALPRNQGGEQPSLPPPNDQQGNQPPPPLAEGEEPPPHPLDGTPLGNIWIYGGEAYDLTEFIMKHPGGEFFIGRSKNRDITTIVNIFHRNPERVKKVLKKYSLGRLGKPEDIHPKCNAPAFLFKNNFNSWEDTPKYKFDNPDHLLNCVRARLKQPDMNQRITQADSWFDFRLCASAGNAPGLYAVYADLPVHSSNGDA
jgi:Cytochrome b5-like Heme/Steroid binding domain